MIELETYLPVRSDHDSSSHSIAEVQSVKKHTVENMMFTQPNLADAIGILISRIEVLEDVLNPAVSRLEQNQINQYTYNSVATSDV